MWLGLTILFGIYVANFGNYNATYGSLGTVVVTLTWLYLSSFILLLGAELNSELEHQTAQDTTRSAAPMGERGAWVADHVAGGSEPIPKDIAVPPNTAMRDVVVGQVASRVGRLTGMPRIGWTTSVAATIGLSLLRHGKGVQGTALLGLAAAIMWLRRDRPEQRIKAVFFDVDGTLVDSNERHVAAWSAAFRQLNYDVAHDAIRSQIGKGGDLLVPALLPGVSAAVCKDLATRHGAVFKRDHLDQVTAFPAAAALLRRVHHSGRRIVLASSADAEEVTYYVTRLDIADVVDAKTTIDDAETSKPAGDIFAAALKKVGLKPSEVIVVGDTPYDTEAAAKCGIQAVAVRSGGFDDAMLHDAGAIAIYDDVAAILADFDGSPLSR